MSEKIATCPVCDWPMYTRIEDGCAPGNCSYRPHEGTSEAYRIQNRRRLIAEEAVDVQ